MAYAVQSDIKAWGNGSGVRLSQRLLDAAELAVHDAIELVAENGQIVIRKTPEKRQSLREKFAQFDGRRQATAEDFAWHDMKRGGKEIW